MSETLGSLVDKLSIVNLKLWFIQDRLQQAAATDKNLDSKDAQMLVALNRQRNQLATEIDQCLDQAVKSGHAEIDLRPKF
jgi:hypothetical protein